MTRPRHPCHITAGALALALLRRSGRATPRRTPAMPRSAPISSPPEPSTPATSRSATTTPRLTVTYEATFPWCLLKTDLHVATSELAGIPQNRFGHPTPGSSPTARSTGCLDGRRASRSLWTRSMAGLSPATPWSSPPTPRSSTKTGARRAPGARAPASSRAATGRCTSPTRSRRLPRPLRVSATVERQPAARRGHRFWRSYARGGRRDRVLCSKDLGCSV